MFTELNLSLTTGLYSSPVLNLLIKVSKIVIVYNEAHALKMYEVVEEYLQAFLILELDGAELLASRPGLQPQGKSPPAIEPRSSSP